MYASVGINRTDQSTTNHFWDAYFLFREIILKKSVTVPTGNFLYQESGLMKVEWLLWELKRKTILKFKS